MFWLLKLLRLSYIPVENKLIASFSDSHRGTVNKLKIYIKVGFFLAATALIHSCPRHIAERENHAMLNLRCTWPNTGTASRREAAEPKWRPDWAGVRCLCVAWEKRQLRVKLIPMKYERPNVVNVEVLSVWKTFRWSSWIVCGINKTHLRFL